MGFMSAYSTFRLSVSRFQQEDGRYDFLGPPKETAGDLLLAPFRFDHLAKPTTWVPIGLVAAIAPVVIYFGRNDNKGADWTLSGDDFAFAAPLSFNAGVSEEAAFRGWLFPVAYQYTGGSFWLANGAQALVFAAAHYDKQDLPLPIPQLLMGFYLGWVTKRDQWSLSESIFIHSWWDMLLLGISIATNTKAPNQVTRIGASVPIPW
jgi:membrane protease YdiL (CAAX protease family)